MSDDLERAFEKAARTPSTPLDVEALPSRAHRLRLKRFTAAGTACLLLIGGGAFAVANWDRGPRYKTPVIAGNGDDCGSVDHDMIVFLRDDITANELQEINDRVVSWEGIDRESITYLSKDEARQIMVDRYGQPMYGSLPAGLGVASIRFSYVEGATVPPDDERLESEFEAMAGVEEVSSAEEVERRNETACLAEETVEEAPPWRVIDWPSTEIGAAASCVYDYPRDLGGREIAFDGTITATVVGEYDENAGAKPVTLYLYVNEVFKGDLPEHDEITMSTWDFMLPDDDVSNVRILAAAGPTLDLMGCGFSRPYSEAEAAEWRTVFADETDAIPNESPESGLAIDPTKTSPGQEVTVTFSAPDNYTWGVDGELWQLDGEDRRIAFTYAWADRPTMRTVWPTDGEGAFEAIGFAGSASWTWTIPERLGPGTYELRKHAISDGVGSVEERTKTWSARFEVR